MIISVLMVVHYHLYMRVFHYFAVRSLPSSPAPMVKDQVEASSETR